MGAGTVFCTSSASVAFSTIAALDDVPVTGPTEAAAATAAVALMRGTPDSNKDTDTAAPKEGLPGCTATVDSGVGASGKQSVRSGTGSVSGVWCGACGSSAPAVDALDGLLSTGFVRKAGVMHDADGFAGAKNG